MTTGSSAPLPRPPQQRKSHILAVFVVVIFGLAIIAVRLVFVDQQWSGIIQGICAVVGVVLAAIDLIKDDEAFGVPGILLARFGKRLGQLLWRFLKWLWQSKIAHALSLGLNFILLLLLTHPWSLPHPSPCEGKGFCVAQMADGQLIGVSDGTPQLFWPGSDVNNAEVKIAQANRDVDQTGDKHITIVVVTTLSPGSQQATGYDELQGVYVFQQKNNDECAQCVKVKVLIANAGGDLQYASSVARQIANIKRNGEPIIGVVGMPFSTPGAIDGIRYLSEQGIPVISSTESSDSLPSLPYYFRVAPLDSQQGLLNAQYVRDNLKAVHRAVVFYSPDNPYSLTLASSFGETFSKGVGSVRYESFQRSDTHRDRQIAMDVQAVQQNMDPSNSLLVFCACYSDDLNTLLGDLRTDPTTSQSFQNVIVDSGDGAYDFGGFNNTSNYKDLYFSAFAFPDEWGSVKCPSRSSFTDASSFFDSYASDFKGESPSCPGGRYGFDRADSGVILAYDAVNVLVTAYSVAQRKITNPRPGDIQQALLGDDGCSSFQGISGQISFAVDGRPVDKALVMLQVDPSGKTHEVGVQGALQAANPCEIK